MAIPLIAPLIGIAQTWLSNRAEIKKGEQAATQAWEQSVGRSMDSGWKDEYITVTITMPLWNIFIGNLMSVWYPERGAALLAANNAAMQQIGALMDTPYGQVMMVVVLAGVGIKTLKAIK